MAKAKLKVDVYKIVARAVEEGVNYGWMRAHKYVEKPSEDIIKDEMERGVMLMLDGVIKFD